MRPTKTQGELDYKAPIALYPCYSSVCALECVCACVCVCVYMCMGVLIRHTWRSKVDVEISPLSWK